MISRRGFLTGLAAGLIVAPAIVKASSLMPLRGPTLILPGSDTYSYIIHGIDANGICTQELISMTQDEAKFFKGPFLGTVFREIDRVDCIGYGRIITM